MTRSAAPGAVPETGALAQQPRFNSQMLPLIFAAALAITVLSYFRFPGHTILQSDTQIYIPILEHIWDPSVLAKDFMASRPHVSFTLYDEAALFLRRVTGASFESILMAQQFVYRFIGVVALFFIACSMRLGPGKAWLVAAILSLGATVNGPAVLTIEYEPVPRGFALPFLLASLASVAYRRWTMAAAAATLAFAFHPPTAVAFCALLLVILVANRRFSDIGVLAAGPALILVTLVLAEPASERQLLFGRLDPELEALQRMRASYNWVSIWLSTWLLHYVLLLILGMGMLWRLRDRLARDLLFLFGGLTVIGVLSIPVSYALLEQAKWVVAPQFQPARYLLFVTFVASLMSSAGAIIAAERRRWLEASILFVIAFAIPMDPKVTNVLLPEYSTGWQRLGLAVALTVLAALAVALANARASAAALGAAALIPFLAIPSIGKVMNYAPLHHIELDQLAEWARTSTSKDSVFQFADAGRDLSQGVFRARAKRALFVDWKAGGQVNFQKQLSEIWRERWEIGQNPQPIETYRALAVDYVVFKAPGSAAGGTPVYRNAKYVVYKP